VMAVELFFPCVLFMYCMRPEFRATHEHYLSALLDLWTYLDCCIVNRWVPLLITVDFQLLGFIKTEGVPSPFFV